MKNLESKVIAATAGSGLAAALSAFLLWVVGVLGFGASSAADQVPKALAAVPEPVGALLAILVAISGAFIGGYSAPHTRRPDLASVAKSVINDAIHDPSVSVDANGHMRLDFADGRALFWDDAAQSFKMNGPTPTPPVSDNPTSATSYSSPSNTSSASDPGTAGTANVSFPYVPPAVAADPTVPAAGS